MKTSKTVKRVAGWPAEYFFKAAGTIGAVGAVFGEDEGLGYEYASRLSNGFRAIEKFPYWISDHAETAMGFAYSQDFFEISRHLGKAANLFQGFGTAYDNMTSNFFMTSLAAGTFLLFGYGIGERMRFYRTEGRGSRWREFMRKKGQERYGWKD